MNIDQETDKQDEESASDKLLLLEDSVKLYNATYDKFIAWTKTKQIEILSEDVLLDYFTELSQKMKPSSLWSVFSMLNSTLKTKNNIELKSYTNLTGFLRKQAAGYKSEKSKTLSSHNIETFLNEAPDYKYLATKAALILGITGACRQDELYNMKISDVKEFNSTFLITIPKRKNYNERSFTVVGEFYNIVKKYFNLRPQNTISKNLFLNYQKGKCTNQVIGINKFGAMPKQIASYLNLSDANTYTGHSFRRTSASLLADSGASVSTLIRLGGWKSKGIARKFVHESMEKKKEVSRLITESIFLKPSKTYEKSCIQSAQTITNESHSVSPTTSILNEGHSKNSDQGTVLLFIDNTNNAPQEEIPQTITKLCRLCVCEKSIELLISFLGTVYEEALRELSPFGLLAPNHQGFPEKICQTCADELLTVRRNIQKFCEADRKLFTMVQSSRKNTEDLDIEEEFGAVEVKLENDVIEIKEEDPLEEDKDSEMKDVEGIFFEEVDQNLFISECIGRS